LTPFFLGSTFRQGDDMDKKTTIKILGVLTILFLTSTVSGALIQYYATIQTSIDVQDIIFIDNTTKSTITDSFSCYPANTTIISHEAKNLHDLYTYKLYFNIQDCSEGLTVEIWDCRDTPFKLSNNILWVNASMTVPFQIRYIVAPNVDPSEDLSCNIFVEFDSVEEMN